MYEFLDIIVKAIMQLLINIHYWLEERKYNDDDME